MSPMPGTLVLHHSPGTRATRVLWLLEELGLPYELRLLTREQRRGAEHRRTLHPLGRVPVLEDGEGPIFESAGICLHLCDLRPEAGLLPAPGTHSRALCYQWAFFAMDEVEPALIQARFDNDAPPERVQAATAQVHAAVGAVDRVLEGRDYLVEDRFTVADLVLGAVIELAQRLEALPEAPNVVRWLSTVTSRPARARAIAVR
jgi:glutathione S-transferase